MGTPAKQLKMTILVEKGQPSAYSVEATQVTLTTYNHHFAQDPASPFNHWSLQWCQTDQIYRYADTWADITRTFFGVTGGTLPYLLIFPESPAAETIFHKSHNISHRITGFWITGPHILVRTHQVRYQHGFQVTQCSKQNK